MKQLMIRAPVAPYPLVFSRRRLLQFLPVSAMFLFLIGCGQSDHLRRKPISGMVYLDGQPVPAGEISFAPDFSQGNSGPGSVVPIVEGKYQTQSGKGIVGGPYKIQILAFDGVATSESPEGSSLLKSAYETQATFDPSSTEQDFHIPASQAIQK